MVSYNRLKIIDLLRERKLVLVDTSMLRELSGLENRQSLASFIKSLEKHNILERAEKGKYLVKANLGDDFQIANLLYQPSYISLESALNLRGILSQFPVEIMSVTTKRKKEKSISNKLFTYYHISPKYYWGYEKVGRALVALPEKALLDSIYFKSKGLRGIDISDLDLSLINKSVLKEFSRTFPRTKKFKKLLKEII